MIERTEQEREASENGDAIRVSTPEIGEDVIPLLATECSNPRESFDDKREQAAFLQFSMKQAAKIAKENPY